MQPIKLNHSYFSEKESPNFHKSHHKTLPLTFIRDVKFFFDISYDDVNLLLLQVEKIKEAKRINGDMLKKFEMLTSKESQVFKLVAQGLSTKEIAKKIFVQPATISTHRKHIKQKLNLESSFDWFSYAKAIQVI